MPKWPIHTNRYQKSKSAAKVPLFWHLFCSINHKAIIASLGPCRPCSTVAQEMKLVSSCRCKLLVHSLLTNHLCLQSAPVSNKPIMMATATSMSRLSTFHFTTSKQKKIQKCPANFAVRIMTMSWWWQGSCHVLMGQQHCSHCCHSTLVAKKSVTYVKLIQFALNPSASLTC